MTCASVTIAGTTPAAASTAVVGAAVTGLDDYDALQIVASLVGATGGTLDVYLQTNPSQDGATWVDYAHFAQLASGASALTVGLSVSLIGQQLTATTLGKNLTPALSAGACLGGVWGRSMRAVAVAGAGTSAGAAISIAITGQSPRKRDG